MLNSLDLLVIVFMLIASLSLLALLLMFLMKNKVVRRISLYVSSAVALYTSAMGLYVYGSMFPGQATVALIAGLAAVAAITIDFVNMKQKSDRLGLIARITAAAALVVGVANAFLI